MCAVKIFFFCFIKLVSFILMLKKTTISNKLDPDVSIVFSNNESKVPARKNLGWVRGVFS